LDSRPLGGAGSARPQMRLCFHRWIAPLGHRAFARRSVIMLRLGLRPARIRGRTECVPPRKPPPALSPGFPRKAILPWMAHPSEGRAPHARLAASLPPGDHPIRPPNVRLPPMIMLCLGLRMALPRGRGDRAPPRTPTSALCQSFPREAIQAWIADPAEGRAPHARK